MGRRSLYVVALGFIIGVVAEAGAGEPAFQGGADDQLVMHVVKPQQTDSAIDRALDDHYAWLDTSVRTNNKLFVFMPGTATPPGAYQLVQQEAARLGYHVIGLMYPNSVKLAVACPLTGDPDACFENARLEILDGIPRRSVVEVSEQPPAATGAIEHAGKPHVLGQGVVGMPPYNRLPAQAVRVPTYVELEQYVRAFAAGHLNLLMLFGLPGVGKLTYDSLQTLDLPVIMATVIYGAFFITIMSAVVDVLYARLDPRIRPT